jgi:lysozyme
VTPESRSLLNKELMRDEDVRLKPYRDTLGKLTVGCGHNLDDRGISLKVAMFILDEDVSDTLEELDRRLPKWRSLNEPRQRVVGNMAFNMGVEKLLGFHQMLGALWDGDYERAADEMLDSVWAWQVKGRAARLAQTMRTGKD